eukprot:21471-Heterococcus_DN1.PRE.3
MLSTASTAGETHVHTGTTVMQLKDCAAHCEHRQMPEVAAVTSLYATSSDCRMLCRISSCPDAFLAHAVQRMQYRSCTINDTEHINGSKQSWLPMLMHNVGMVLDVQNEGLCDAILLKSPHNLSVHYACATLGMQSQLINEV